MKVVLSYKEVEAAVLEYVHRRSTETYNHVYVSGGYLVGAEVTYEAPKEPETEEMFHE